MFYNGGRHFSGDFRTLTGETNTVAYFGLPSAWMSTNFVQKIKIMEAENIEDGNNTLFTFTTISLFVLNTAVVILMVIRFWQ